jgi:hypothetical protein
LRPRLPHTGDEATPYAKLRSPVRGPLGDCVARLSGPKLLDASLRPTQLPADVATVGAATFAAILVASPTSVLASVPSIPNTTPLRAAKRTSTCCRIADLRSARSFTSSTPRLARVSASALPRWARSQRTFSPSLRPDRRPRAVPRPTAHLRRWQPSPRRIRANGWWRTKGAASRRKPIRAPSRPRRPLKACRLANLPGTQNLKQRRVDDQRLGVAHEVSHRSTPERFQLAAQPADSSVQRRRVQAHHAWEQVREQASFASVAQERSLGRYASQLLQEVQGQYVGVRMFLAGSWLCQLGLRS